MRTHSVDFEKIVTEKTAERQNGKKNHNTFTRQPVVAAAIVAHTPRRTRLFGKKVAKDSTEVAVAWIWVNM